MCHPYIESATALSDKEEMVKECVSQKCYRVIWFVNCLTWWTWIRKATEHEEEIETIIHRIECLCGEVLNRTMNVHHIHTFLYTYIPCLLSSKLPAHVQEKGWRKNICVTETH